MKKILVFGASNSETSINRQLANYAADQLKDVDLVKLDMNDFEMPIYSPKRNKEGIPEPAKKFKELLRASDGLIISFAEHNGSYTAIFKNLLDWASVIEKDMWLGKYMFLMATSPGPRGGIAVLKAAAERFPFMGGNVVAQFSLPSFGQNFSSEEGIKDETLNTAFKKQLEQFVATL